VALVSQMRARLLHETFAPVAAAAAAENVAAANPARVLLVTLVEMLEAVEQLPVFTHDAPGSGHGLQSLTRRLRFRLKRLPDDKCGVGRGWGGDGGHAVRVARTLTLSTHGWLAGGGRAGGQLAGPYGPGVQGRAADGRAGA
jgi:hypothetical protein